MDIWLEEHFEEATRESENFPEISEQVPSIVNVLSEHPVYDFQEGDLVALVAGDEDPFWLAEITAVHEESLSVTYFHHSSLKPGKKLIWKKHHSHRTCGVYDVYAHFQTKEQLFTKTNILRKKAWKKISQACLTYNEIEVPDSFK